VKRNQETDRREIGTRGEKRKKKKKVIWRVCVREKRDAIFILSAFHFINTPAHRGDSDASFVAC
jgi:hypothetical protein